MPDIVEEAARIFSGETELSFGERTALVIGGLGLMAVGAQPRPNKILSLVAIVAGAGMALRGATNQGALAALTSGGEGRSFPRSN